MLRRQSGQGKIGCILWLLALGIAIYAAVKMVPIKVASVELYDYMEEQAKWAARNSPERLKAGIVKKAEELGLPLDEKQIKVEKAGRRIRMEAKYTIPVDFGVWVYEWEFHHLIDRQIFII